MVMCVQLNVYQVPYCKRTNTQKRWLGTESKNKVFNQSITSAAGCHEVESKHNPIMFLMILKGKRIVEIEMQR